MLLSFLYTILLFSISVSARPEPYHGHQRRCVVPSSNGQADDSPAISAAFAQCAHNGIVTFSLGVDYNVFAPISATNLSNVKIEMHGNLHLPQNITYMQQIYNQSTTEEDDDLYWFKLAGPGLHYQGTPNVTTGWIYSYGQGWWDANPTNGTGLDGRPHLMSFDTTNGGMKHFKSRKPIAWGVQVSGSDILIEDTVIDASSTTGSFPFNTDGFDVGAENVRILNSVIYNGDDAIAVQSGSHNVLFQGGTIGYQSHGMSVGSLGQDQSQFANVSDIVFDDITVIDAVYAARFKSWQGGQGLAKNISWTNIRVYNVTFPIFVTQTYINQGSSQTQIGNGAVDERPNNSTVDMENMRWENFTGTINTYQPGDGSCVTDVKPLHQSMGSDTDVLEQPCWYDVGLPNLSHTEAVIVECNTNTSCRDFQMRNIEVFPQDLEMPEVICFNATAKLNPELGFACRNGSFVPTP